MTIKSTIAFALLSLSVSAWATTNSDCVKATEEDIEKLFERWNESLKSGDAKKVAANYLSDAVLLPTLSNKIRLTDEERQDYFEHFLEKNTGKINTRNIRIGCNEAIDVGTYTFNFADNTSVAARYSFTYSWDGKKWKISSHHSSVMPES